MAKLDIESVYQLVPVYPEDRPALSMHAIEWGSQLYVDPMLPFGLHSAPKIFKAQADGQEWYLRKQGIRHVFHYLSSSSPHLTLQNELRPCCGSVNT